MTGTPLDLLIIGAGPAGLQLAAFLEQDGTRDYLVLDGAPAPGSFFARFPRHRTLISINKPHTGSTDPELNLRLDWNSLLGDRTPLFTSYTERYFPDADVMVRYLADFAAAAGVRVRYNARVARVHRGEFFEVTDTNGETYRARRLVVATGVSRPYLPPIPGIEAAESYDEVSVDPRDFTDQRVLIIGKGNSAFETADNLMETTTLIHGFRYSVRALHRILERRYHDVPWPVEKIEVDATAVADAIIARVNRTSALWQQFGVLADVVTVGGVDARYHEEVPVDYFAQVGLSTDDHQVTDAFVVTVDSPVFGRRERDLRNGFLDLPDGLACENMREPGAGHPREIAWDPGLGWDTVAWLRALTPLPIVLKGVLHPADARLAVEHGVDGIVVSNHGGRQLDGAVATIEALPAVVDAVAGRLPVLLDGGVRRGTDVVTALALGASAVAVGRPVVWGLAAGGTDGARAVLELLREDVDRAMALCGADRPSALTSDLVVPARWCHP